MEFERFASDPVSRRRFFRAAGVATAGGGSAALLAACGGGSGKPKDKSAIAADIAILNRALNLENTAIAAYTAGAPFLKGGVIKLARELLGQEKDHADALSTAVTHLGGHPPRPKSAYDFPRVHDQGQVLRLVDMIEHELVGAYLDALPRLSSPDLRAQVTSIVANEGEHVAVLLGVMGRPQAPSAFVTGPA